VYGKEIDKENPIGVEITILVCDRSPYVNALWSQFGLSMLIECRWSGEMIRRILFDTGWTAEPVLHNMEALGVTMESIDALVLSHSHYDHTGGLAGILEAEGARFQVVAHTEITRPVFSTRRKGVHYIGLDPGDLGRLPQSRLLLIKEPLELFPGVWVSGTIPRRTDFEKPETGVYVLKEGEFVPDPELDDMAIVLNMGRKGIVVVTGCCHAGIVNTIKAAREITGNPTVYGVIGGLHLIDLGEEVRKKTIESLSEFSIGHIWSGHCTGWDAEIMLQESFGERSSRFYTGDRITIPVQNQEENS